MPRPRSRRSTEIIAPGFGTQTDLERLARDLFEGGGGSTNDTAAPPIAASFVNSMMNSRGRGRRRREVEPEETPAAATPTSSAWADFMQEEGMVVASTTTTAISNDGAVAKRSRGANGDDDNEPATEEDDKKPAAAEAEAQGDGKSQTYKLDFSKKKSKPTAGLLVQSGTLNSAIVGREKKLLNFKAPYSCEVPTILKLPVKVRSVFSAGHACHTIAITESGEVYGWGRNEQGNLGVDQAKNVFSPTRLSNVPPGRVHAAAVGKGHTLLLIDGAIFAVGSNKVGQCGMSGVTEQAHSFRQVKFSGDDEPTIVQIACGESFSVALSDEGHLYTTGSAEFGCLGSGSTGEHFVTANKLAFANGHAFTKRTVFCHAPAEQVHKNNDSTVKVVPLGEDIRIRAIACGKNHTVALEAERLTDGAATTAVLSSRVFTWGNGNYGVLGHGVQADEYRPRLVGALSRIGVAGAKFITAGQTCNLLLTQQGHVYYWGKHRTVGEATMRPTLIDALANNQHVVTSCSAGGQTVVCSTSTSQTVAWGMGSHGELGLGSKKSSSKPAFVETLDGVQVLDVACGYGHTVFVVDPASAKKLNSVDAAKETAML